MRIYNIDLLVSGPITTKGIINFNTDKELDIGNIFRSDISIKKHAQGVIVSSTVYTSDQDRAYKVALLFIGRMLDVLAMKTNMPINVSSNEYRNLSEGNVVRALINEYEFRVCFELARALNLHENKLLRAFSWYRKGLYTEDPFDKFLAFWNSISVVADGYCSDNPRTRQGIINKIWDCFITIWGECRKWEYINGDQNWIKNNNDIRNVIAHGGTAVEIEYVENVITQLYTVQKVAYKFLTEWAEKLNRPLNEL